MNILIRNLLFHRLNLLFRQPLICLRNRYASSIRGNDGRVYI
jgi:hypothetical protein